MRISHIGARVFPVDSAGGGIEGHVEAIGKELARNGHEVTVYVRQRSICKNVISNGLRVRYRAGLPTKGLNPAVSALLAAWDAAIGGADIVHFHGEGAALFSWLPRLAGRRVVTTIHGLDWKRGKWGPVGRATLRLGEWIASRASDEVVCVSRDLCEYWERRYGRRPRHLPNAPTPAPAGEGGRILRRYGLRAGGYLLYVGRLVPEKRIEILIAAFAQLVGSAPDRFGELRLVIGGVPDHTERYARRLRREARGLPVIFAGALPAGERADLLDRARLFVLPSALEGMPLSLLEAMAAGVPCVASDLPVHREMIQDGRSGWIFPTDSVAGLVSALRKALASARSGSIGRRASMDIRQGYRWDVVVRDLVRIYHAINGRSRSLVRERSAGAATP